MTPKTKLKTRLLSGKRRKQGCQGAVVGDRGLDDGGIWVSASLCRVQEQNILESFLLPGAPERNTSSFFLGISKWCGPRLAMTVLLGTVVWADGQLAPAQHGHGPLWSPSGLRDGVLQTAVGNWEPEGKAGCSWNRGCAFPWL